jgi:hypothetical protein
MKRRRTTDTPRLRQAEEKKRRVGGRHCPVCLELLPSLGGRPARRCASCGGQPVPDRRCAKCDGNQLWEGSANAACAACGHHGSKVGVFAGQEWLKERRPGERS